jgi:hypothetical protein
LGGVLREWGSGAAPAQLERTGARAAGRRGRVVAAGEGHAGPGGRGRCSVKPRDAKTAAAARLRRPPASTRPAPAARRRPRAPLPPSIPARAPKLGRPLDERARRADAALGVAAHAVRAAQREGLVRGEVAPHAARAAAQVERGEAAEREGLLDAQPQAAEVEPLALQRERLLERRAELAAVLRAAAGVWGGEEGGRGGAGARRGAARGKVGWSGERGGGGSGAALAYAGGAGQQEVRACSSPAPCQTHQTRVCAGERKTQCM